MEFKDLFVKLLDQSDYVKMYPSEEEYFIEGWTRKSKEFFDFHEPTLEGVITTALNYCKEENDRFNLQR